MKDTVINQSSILKINPYLKQALLLFFIGGFGITLLISLFAGMPEFSIFIRRACLQGLIWVILWMGNGLLNDYLTSKISWLEKPELRFSLGIILTVVYTVGSLWVLVVLWVMFINGNPFSAAVRTFDQGLIITALIITAFISVFLHGKSFLQEWRASASEAERLRSENLKARFETLKNQVNPHFLFNSFNVLSTLVYKDQDKAANFIKQLSMLYRYVLDTKEKETVSIKEEYEALKAFSYLSEIRFGESLNIIIDLKDAGQKQIAPMTLQMLVENAIKHNVISNARPLKIEVFQENDNIIVRNNLQRKSHVPSSAGVGLPNILARYELLSDRKVNFSESNDHFIVKIPLLKL